MSTQQAEEQLSRHLSFLTQDENNLTLLIKVSDLYLELNDLEAAQEYLDKASTIDREACLGHQGLLYLNQGQFTQAKEYFSEALNHVDTPALRYNLSFTHFVNSELEDVSKILSPILNGELHPEANLLMARALHGQGDLDTALDLVNEVLIHHQDDSEALGLLALLHFDMDESELAAEASGRALAINPDNYDAKLIDVMSRLVTQETSPEEIEELLQINPDDCRLWFALGNVHMSQGNLDLAEHTLKKSVEIYPEFYDCYIALGWCLLLNDNLEEAFEAYQTAAEFAGELADSWGGLALVHALREEFSKAEELMEKAKSLNPNCFLTEIAETIYFNHKNPLQAKEHLIKALKSSNVPVGQKLAFILEDLQTPTQLH